MRMTRSGSSLKWMAGIAGIFTAGVIFTVLFNAGLAYTNTQEFCTSCHSMKVNLEELKETPHFKSASGVAAICSDCHVPRAFLPKMKAKILAYKDVLHEILGTINTREKYEARRREMANRVWARMKVTDSSECRSCHAWDSMDLSEQDKTARKRHGRARDEGRTRIDCHKGITHEEPDEPEEDNENEMPATSEGTATDASDCFLKPARLVWLPPVLLLLERGADPAITNRDGQTAQDIASARKAQRILALLDDHRKKTKGGLSSD